MPETTVCKPLSEWNEMKRVVKAASQYLRELTHKQAREKPIWLSRSKFCRLTGETIEQWRYLREVIAPELFRVKLGRLHTGKVSKPAPVHQL